MKAVYQRDHTKDLAEDIDHIRAGVPVPLIYVGHDENRIEFVAACDCKYKHDICYCDGTCQVGG